MKYAISRSTLPISGIKGGKKYPVIAEDGLLLHIENDRGDRMVILERGCAHQAAARGMGWFTVEVEDD